ncbi:glycosyltransferase family 2 protein [Actinomadura yumaensis]|uniref:glycosyltransferase family 2 protein n=1 Tax=Actinomadura yumaensis TaxID=111807 RepID=UPI0036241061
MPPKLSVVVLGDAPRLDECLGSLAAQTLRELEVVVVGSSAAGAWCERDGRFRTAERWETAATGEYVAFARPDGRVPAHAYEELVGSLERTGADVACGAVQGCGRAPDRGFCTTGRLGTRCSAARSGTARGSVSRTVRGRCRPRRTRWRSRWTSCRTPSASRWRTATSRGG